MRRQRVRLEGVRGISVVITGHQALTEVGIGPRGPRKAAMLRGVEEAEGNYPGGEAGVS